MTPQLLVTIASVLTGAIVGGVTIYEMHRSRISRRQRQAQRQEDSRPQGIHFLYRRSVLILAKLLAGLRYRAGHSEPFSVKLDVGR